MIYGICLQCGVEFRNWQDLQRHYCAGRGTADVKHGLLLHDSAHGKRQKKQSSLLIWLWNVMKG
ncbi:hypothetical protein KSF_108000 [Reticulibacter mediterranei]|uniref:C2H2-type domain-containing protein n=1 Tax=Reticulibacter mediterranei TaxID=2778369 RepID=A0A8J3J1Q9_9CHLR|nr:hypothetical protein KSF_108000 [Reticulibacter mediterranei]